ncbi:TPA: colicin M resistance protein CbrA, partial [Citrobacter freundii]|nr:colicin M resistance protein CbrA [Citrobacter freundii]
MEHFDVAIIGLGPAGAALARQLSGKMRVIALDKKRQCGNEGFTKPCGGLLAPDAQRS